MCLELSYAAPFGWFDLMIKEWWRQYEPSVVEFAGPQVGMFAEAVDAALDGRDAVICAALGALPSEID